MCEKCGMEIPPNVTIMWNKVTCRPQHLFDCTSEVGQVHAFYLLSTYKQDDKV